MTSLLQTFSRRVAIAGAAALSLALISAPVSAAGLEISEGDAVFGNRDAKVTIIEYASMSCPHCGSFHNGDYKKLKEDYIDTGKIAFVYRDLPWNGAAFRAALMARCLDADKYESAISLVYKTQSEWLKSSNDPASLQEALNKVFAITGLTPEKAEECINHKANQEKILASRAEALDVHKVSGTPYFFINGKVMDRSNGYRSFQEQIDKLLDK